MLQTSAKIISNRRIKKNYWHCVFYSPDISKSALAGQFISLKLTDNFEPFFRRPFSIHRVREDKVEIFYEVLGPGTGILSNKKKGSALDIIGPLGKGFSYKRNEPAILVAGGMGVAPLLFLAEKINEIANSKCKTKNLILIGARTKSGVLCEKEFKDLGFNVKIATDDGSAGFKGKVTELLGKVLREVIPGVIYSCGPKPMLKAASKISGDKNIPAQISLEEHMSCGFGACLGCAVNTKDGFMRVCKDGPVFDSKQIVW